MQKLIGKMARMYPLLIAMGFMIVAIAFVVGGLNSRTAAEYFSQTKAVRETSLLSQRASIESTGIWLPYFEFLGIGLILGGIVMALRVIIDNLRAAGQDVLSNLPEQLRPAPPTAPWYGLLMPVVMMLGEAIFVVALIVGLDPSATARAVFAHPIPEIDAAGAGSALLAQLQSVVETSAWLVPFKSVGVATEFLAIVMGLSTIIYILTQQTRLLERGFEIGRQVAAGQPNRTRLNTSAKLAAKETSHG